MANSSPHLIDTASAPAPLGLRAQGSLAPGLHLPGLERLLGEAGLPRGAVVEVGSPGGLGCASRLVLASCAAAQRQARAHSHDGQSCWCAWLDATKSLYAPGALRAGVDLDRLLVVHPTAAELARVAVRVASSRVFSVVVIDRCGVPGAALPRTRTRWSLVARRLSLAVEGSDCTVLLLSRAATAEREALPTALRLELTRPGLGRLEGRIARDRRGRHSGPVALAPEALWLGERWASDDGTQRAVAPADEPPPPEARASHSRSTHASATHERAG